MGEVTLENALKRIGSIVISRKGASDVRSTYENQAQISIKSKLKENPRKLAKSRKIVWKIQNQGRRTKAAISPALFEAFLKLE